jgi:alpha,alpha-trehalase
MAIWTLAYQGFEPKQESLREALCALGNGYFCTRGAAEWADADEVHYPGTYLAGGYNRLVTEVSGRLVENEDLVNMPNWLCLTFRIEDGDWFNLGAVDLLSYSQKLNTDEGVLVRRMRFRDREGRETWLTSRRIVHMGRPHLAAIEWTLTPQNWTGRLEVRSALDGRVTNYGIKRYRELNGKHLEPLDSGSFGDDVIYVLVQTTQSRRQVAEAARTSILLSGEAVEAEVKTVVEDGYAAQLFAFEAVEGRSYNVEKVVALFTSRDRAISEPALKARATATRVDNFATLLRTHRQAWELMWRRCDITLIGCEPVPLPPDSTVTLADSPEPTLTDSQRMQMILRVHIFHLLQTVSRNTVGLDVGMPARGLHGEAYRGHIFWDELFIFPFLTYSVPEITRALLMYRYRRLDQARELAEDAGFRGAMFPWQSGSDGREETQQMHLNPKSGRWIPDLSHNQRHVSLAVAYNVCEYFEVTGDEVFMSVYGTEMLLEIARFFASLTKYNAGRGRYEIHGVMGPDEYHEKYPDSDEEGLRNNAYTNLMVSWLLDHALRALEGLQDYRRAELREILELDDQELSLWVDISHKLYVPFHDGDIISQFEGYEQLKELDWDGYRKKYGDIHRLDRILEAEGDTANRYKVSKQADVLMLFYLFSSGELSRIFDRLGYSFDPNSIPKNIDYYARRTSHGSTLSNIVESAVLSRSDLSASWKMFCRALESDVGDIQNGTTAEGIHLGAMAGTVDLLQRCYTGLEIRDGVLVFDPLLPVELEGLVLGLRFQGIWLDVKLTHSRLSITARKGGLETVRVGVRDRVHYIRAGYTREFEI